MAAKILVVEDEKIVAMDIQNRLESYGYCVPAIASTGEEAIKKTEEIHPDLLLMDIMIKGNIDGVKAAELIQAKFDIPIVYLTAYSDDITLQRAKITQPFGYIIKPFEERELHVAIEIALYKHTMEKKLKDREQWLTATLNSVSDAVITTDEKGIVNLLNPFGEALIGRKKEEVIGRPLKYVFNIISEVTGKQAEDPVEKVFREGSFYGLAEDTVLIANDGSKKPVEIIGSPILDGKNKFLGVVLVFMDIHERKKAQDMQTQNRNSFAEAKKNPSFS